MGRQKIGHWGITRLPTEVPVGVVPLLRRVQIESCQPPLLRAAYRAVEVIEERGRRSDTQVCQQASQEAGGAPEGALEIHLFRRIELPRDELAEDGIGPLRAGKHTVTNNRRPARNEGELARVAVMDIG